MLQKIIFLTFFIDMLSPCSPAPGYKFITLEEQTDFAGAIIVGKVVSQNSQNTPSIIQM